MPCLSPTRLEHGTKEKQSTPVSLSLSSKLHFVLSTLVERHEETLFLSVDGNFRLVRKLKPGDPNDVAFSEGQSYFVSEAVLQSYLAEVHDEGDVSWVVKYVAT